MLARPEDGSNPYRVHAELGRVMTEAATVVRHNKDLAAAYGVVEELEQKARRCSLSDAGNWANQNVVFTRALEDMFPVAKAILQGALARDECRGAHYKPEFAIARRRRRRERARRPSPGGAVGRRVRGEQRENG